MSERRVLMIAHHFPPSAGSGANRALAFTRYLPEHGWQATIVTPGAAWASPRDDTLARETPSTARIVRTRSLEPYPRRVAPAPLALEPYPSDAAPASVAHDSPSGANRSAPAPTNARRRSSSLRSHLGHLKRFPDAHLGWLPFALAAARRERYAVAYSSSGPFTSHLVGLVLKKLTGRPWVAELRDGWYRWNRAIFPDYPAWRNVLESRLESAALHTADRVVLVTERMAAAFKRQYADLASDHFRVVPNGFDPAQFSVAPAVVPEGDRFELVHTGSLYYGRSLATFLEAAARLVERNRSFADAFGVTLVGSLDGAARAELGRGRLGDRVRFVGQVSHAASLDAMRRADLLLLVANTTPGAEATVPGKLFEYLAVGRPILAVAPTESSTADVLAQTGGGCLAAADDAEAIACALERAFVGGVPQPDPARVRAFSRRALAGDLAALFDELI